MDNEPEYSSNITPDNEYNAIKTNSAIIRCTDAWLRANNAALDKGEGPDEAQKQANKAYCRAMPPLTGPNNIRNFIACVTHGILIDAVSQSVATKLLYAAQVAHSTQPKCTKRSKNSFV